MQSTQTVKIARSQKPNWMKSKDKTRTARKKEQRQQRRKGRRIKTEMQLVDLDD